MAQMNLSTEKKNHGHGKQTCGCQVGGGECGMVGVTRYKLLPLEWISNEILLYSNEILLYSTGSYI